MLRDWLLGELADGDLDGDTGSAAAAAKGLSRMPLARELPGPLCEYKGFPTD
jgi:hypothetical protein